MVFSLIPWLFTFFDKITERNACNRCLPVHEVSQLVIVPKNSELFHSLLFFTQVAGPLFVAVSDFQRQISSVESQRQLSSALGSEALKLICLLLHIMEPYANGFRYQPNISADRPPVGMHTRLLTPFSVYVAYFFHVSHLFSLARRPLFHVAITIT
jgi:hypothetical protein